MKIINLKHPYSKEEIINKELVLALGFFDGVHRGHQEVIKTAVELANERGFFSAVLTFNHTPRLVYEKIHPQRYTYLSIYKRKMELLKNLGIDYVYISEFTYAFGHQSPQEFVDNYIVGLGAKVVVAGFDYTYGPKDMANMDTLVNHAKDRFEIIKIPKQVVNNDKIASTSIRQYLHLGQLEKANKELGYIYQTHGIVINGLKRGSTKLGYPTANIASDWEQTLPGIGVYVVEFWVQGNWYYGMASIGYNITFDDVEDLSVEVYILDFDKMIYGESVKIKWHHYLRGEEKFPSIEKLISQLDQDLIDTRNYFKEKIN
ncbi:riboflavin biosynthesis protein RibF [Facklamia sp. DSM 111018]|uniref:Riboflavin biosynthesis protein n=1 Tax=Facklamia lactis TaxID=2749967 RepID=A0ABS0LMD4_9LACT|nr:riboflavin biosynthesis protein RibF [Facklamia lactis]MBG9985303.1 riboflavin biosynthesis protein RibF [Facklamia lactis]